MSGNKRGGAQAAATNKARYGEDYYSKIGSLGGKSGNTGGFSEAIPCKSKDCEFSRYKGMNHLIRECAGARGGRVSRRAK